MRAISDFAPHLGLHLDELEYLLVSAVLAGLIIGIVATAPSLREYFRPISRRTWVAFLGIVCVHLLGSRLLAPEVPWEAVHHGVKLWGQMTQGNELTAEGAIKHGYGCYVLPNVLLHDVFFGRVSLFTVFRLISAAALVPAFLFSRALFRRDFPALLTVLVLVLHPMHIRLSGTEPMFVPLELFVACFLLFYRVYIDTGRLGHFLTGTTALLLAMETRGEFLVLGPFLSALLFGFTSPDSWKRAVRPPAIMALCAVAVLLIPRVLGNEVMDHGLRQVAPYMTYGLWGDVGPVFGWFNAVYTPVPLMVFCLFGIKALRGDRLLLRFLVLWWLSFTILSSAYYGDIRNYVRFNYSILLPPALLSAAGLEWLLWWPRARWQAAPVWAAGAALIATGLWQCHPFLTTEFDVDQEFRLLERMETVLPANAHLLVFEREDEGRGHYALGWFNAAPGAHEVRRIDSVEWFLSEDRRSEGGPFYYYRGAPCLGGVGNNRAKPMLHPTCQALESRYHLIPLVEGSVHPTPFEGGRLEGAFPVGGTVGLYRLAETDNWGPPPAAIILPTNDWLNRPFLLLTCVGCAVIIAFRAWRGRRALQPAV